VKESGANHRECTVDEVVVDMTNKVVSTPAYMLGPNIIDIRKGISKLVREVIALAN
jgi:enhancing lycopene biosynthesis protein 2